MQLKFVEGWKLQKHAINFHKFDTMLVMISFKYERS